MFGSWFPHVFIMIIELPIGSSSQHTWPAWIRGLLATAVLRSPTASAVLGCLSTCASRILFQSAVWQDLLWCSWSRDAVRRCRSLPRADKGGRPLVPVSAASSLPESAVSWFSLPFCFTCRRPYSACLWAVLVASCPLTSHADSLFQPVLGLASHCPICFDLFGSFRS